MTFVENQEAAFYGKILLQTAAFSFRLIQFFYVTPVQIYEVRM